MRFEVALTAEANLVSSNHLLQHYRGERQQEDLCFGLWRPSTGRSRYTALIDEIILPEEKERILHGNTSFEPNYLSRAIKLAKEREAGLVFMHSHPGPGWQDMSATDVHAEQNVLAYPAGATGLPLVGLTIGIDGYWSARFWKREGKQMRCHWCEKVRVIGPQNYTIYYNDNLAPSPKYKEVLRRTFEAWGHESQGMIARMNVGIIGLGSVGCIVAEAIARVGITRVTLIDPDIVEEHNLDRLLYGTQKNIGQLKVDLAAQAMRNNTTADAIEIKALPVSVHDEFGYKAALDCDILFSCVDRPVARDVLNFVAHAHLIPVIDGGIAIETGENQNRLLSAHWRAHLDTPYHQCLRCNGQYTTSDVVMELDGSLDDPSYISNLPPEGRIGNQNVFPFSLGVAGMEVNLMLRYLLAANWWPTVRQQDYQFITGETRIINSECHPSCSFRERRAQGDLANPAYLMKTEEASEETLPYSMWQAAYRRFSKVFGKVFWRT